MFTGIVSAVGRVVEWRPGRLVLEEAVTASRLEAGGSVAVNGGCLTVTEREGAVFFADVVPETQRRTNLGRLKPGEPVNLELPLRADQGLDGHLVQGHVDGTAWSSPPGRSNWARRWTSAFPESWPASWPRKAP